MILWSRRTIRLSDDEIDSASQRHDRTSLYVTLRFRQYLPARRAFLGESNPAVMK